MNITISEVKSIREEDMCVTVNEDDINVSVTVNDILERPFKGRPQEERLQIIKHGKPRPTLPNIKNSQQFAGKTVSPGFDVAYYDKVEWLTGCEKRQSLFCWPCLLSRSDKEIWNSGGVKDLEHLDMKILYHSKNVLHLQSILEWKILLKEIQGGKPTEMVPTKEFIKRNRQIARRILDAICFSVSQQHPLGAGNKNRIKTEDCIQNLQFVRDYDIRHISVIDDAIDLFQTTPKIVGDMVESINSVMRRSIQKEIQESTYVAMILSEHCQEPDKSQISVVLRYLKGSVVCERFVEFINTHGTKTPELICKYISKIIQDFQIYRLRIIACAFDGAVFECVQRTKEAKDTLCSNYPYVNFVPCHFHKLDHLLRQALSFQGECQKFFNNIIVLGSYFRKGSEMSKEFQSFLARNEKTREIPNFDILDAPSYVQCFEGIQMYRKDLILFLEDVFNSSENTMIVDLAKTRGLCAFLKDFRTFFFLETLTKFFTILIPLDEASCRVAATGLVCMSAFDALLIQQIYEAFLREDKISKPQEDKISKPQGFDQFWEELIEKYEKMEKPIKEEVVLDMNQKFLYRQIYLNVLRCIASQLRYRLLCAEKLEFIHISDFRIGNKGIVDKYLEKLGSAYGTCFSLKTLEQELISLRGKEKVQSCKSTHQLMELFLIYGLNTLCPNVFKLMQLVLTMPCSLPNLQSGASKLEDLTAWCYTPEKEENTGDLSLMRIERNYLEEMRKSFSFFNEVVPEFQERNNCLQLLFT